MFLYLIRDKEILKVGLFIGDEDEGEVDLVFVIEVNLDKDDRLKEVKVYIRLEDVFGDIYD